MINPFGWIGSVLVFVGLYLTGQKFRAGFLVGAVAELFWLAYSVTIGSVELGLMSIAFVAIYVYNFQQWKGS